MSRRAVAVILWADGDLLYADRPRAGEPPIGEFMRDERDLEAQALGNNWRGRAPANLLAGKPAWVLLTPAD